MDVLTFIAKILEIAAWPIVVVTLVLMLRGPIGSAIALWESIKARYKDTELEIRRHIGQVVEKAERAHLPPALEPATTSTTTTPAPDRPFGTESAIERYRRLIELSPRAGILEAWTDIERELYRLSSGSGSGGSGSGGRLRVISPSRLISELETERTLDHSTASLLNELRTSRNRIVHNRNATISADDALDYAMIALRIIARLHDSQERAD